MNLSIKFYIENTWLYAINCLNAISPTYATKILHYRTTKDFLNLKKPVTFNEKLQWLKLYWNDPLISICADKYEIYNYVKLNSNPKILNNLLSVYDSADQIIWEELPKKFALKCTHGSGYNIVTNNKSELNQLEVIEKLNKWMKEKFGRYSLEPHYDKIKPRIILEEYIESSQGFLPIDYKIYCFNGVAKLVLICSERENDIKFDCFDLEWNRLSIMNKKYESNIEIKRPDCFDEMIQHANLLAKPFPFVRVDFYDKDGSVILGEMTFTPAANMDVDYTDYGQKYLGDLLTLPKKI